MTDWKRRRRPAKGQKHLSEQERANDLAQKLDFVEWTNDFKSRIRSISAVAVAMTERKWECVRELTISVACCAYRSKDRRCHKSADELLEKVKDWTDFIVTVDQLYRTLSAAKKLGLIASTYGAAERGKRSHDVLWIVDRRIDELVAATRSASCEQPRPGANSRDQVRTAANSPSAPARAPSNPPKGDCENSFANTIPNQSSFSLPSDSQARTAHTAANATGAGRPLATWSEAEEEVLNAGVWDYKAAVDAARSRGASPELVLQLVAWWRARIDAWLKPEGALWSRLMRHNGRVAVDEGWPKPRPDYRDPKDTAARRARHEQQLAEQLRRREAFLAARKAAHESFEQRSPEP